MRAIKTYSLAERAMRPDFGIHQEWRKKLLINPNCRTGQQVENSLSFKINKLQ